MQQHWRCQPKSSCSIHSNSDFLVCSTHLKLPIHKGAIHLVEHPVVGVASPVKHGRSVVYSDVWREGKKLSTQCGNHLPRTKWESRERTKREATLLKKRAWAVTANTKTVYSRENWSSHRNLITWDCCKDNDSDKSKKKDDDIHTEEERQKY